MALINKVIGVATGLGERLFPDRMMDTGTRGLIDLGDVWSHGPNVTELPDTPMSIVDTIGNYALADDGWSEAPATVNYALPRTNGLVRMAPTPGRNVLLPPAFEPSPGELHLAWCFWLQAPKTGWAGANFNKRLFMHRPDGTSGNENIGLTPTVTAVGGVNTVTSLSIGGKVSGSATRSLAAHIDAIFDNQLNQLAIEYLRSADVGGQRRSRVNVYLNGAPLAQFADALDNTDFVAPGANRMLIGAQSSLQESFTGAFARAWIEDLTVAGARPLIETLVLDWEQNRDRLRGLV